MEALNLTHAVAAGQLTAGAAVRVTSPALPPADVRWIGPGYRFVLAREYRLLERGLVISIPEGFEFNAASVPRVAWVAISPLDLGVVSVLVHDWLYATGGQGGRFSRKAADRVFLDHMRTEQVSWWRRTLAYRAVRLAGGSSWRG